MMPNLSDVIAEGGAPTIRETSAMEQTIDTIERLIKVVNAAAVGVDKESTIWEGLEILQVMYHQLIDLVDDCYAAQDIAAGRR